MLELLEPLIKTLLLLILLALVAPVAVGFSFLDDRLKDWVSRLNPWPKKK